MAQFSYSQYVQQQAEKKQKQKEKGNGQTFSTGTSVHFMNEYLKDDGDVAVVRFPYHSMEDITIDTTHLVTFPGEKYPRRVRCDGDGCVLCKQKVKLDTRVFIKAIVYVVNSETGNVDLVPTIWDRPVAFADIDLQNLVSEYGDLSEHLFKIKRNGRMQDTTYTISLIVNTTVYNPEIYRKDFTSLANINPVNILTRSVKKYLDAVNQKSNEGSSEPVQSPAPKIQRVEPVVEQVKPEPKIEPQDNVDVTPPATERKVSRYSF